MISLFSKSTLKSESLTSADRKHVFRDLRPYMCTFENCIHSEKLYVTRHDWMFHEMQMHRRQWVCRSCDESFRSRHLIEIHMREIHPRDFTEKQLPVLLDLCERSVDSNELTDCPLCETLVSLRGAEDLQGHLGWHLEQLALFLLTANDSEETSLSPEVDSNRAMRGQAREKDP